MYKTGNRDMKIIFIIITLIFWSVLQADADPRYHAEVFQQLDVIKEKKKAQLTDYLERVTQNAVKIKTDSVMCQFFKIKKRFYKLKKEKTPPEKLKSMIHQLKDFILEHYLKNYLMFYDIMFVSTNGDIFYTIRKESDYHRNIFQQENLANTALAKQLKKSANETFVDYQYYAVSDEPSAFFIEPYKENNKLEGWFIMQCAIGKINSLFSQDDVHGDTGEAFLVNKERQMLTDSRFLGDSSILKQYLSKENIAAKFKEKVGHKIVVDYRGHRVLSSFEVISVMQNEWLMITKIDEDEVVTNYYKANRDCLRKKIINSFKGRKGQFQHKVNFSGKKVRVDMDEFQKVHDKEILFTMGVSTCTAVIASYPKRFSYMTHLSVHDQIYGGKSTDILTHIIKRINYFDAYKYERCKLNFIIVAKHLETIGNIIDKLVNSGFFLSQIHFIYNPDNEYGSVFHDYQTSKTEVEWKESSSKCTRLYQHLTDAENIGNIVKKLLEDS